MKQSSIEWLYNNLKSHFEHDDDLLEAVQMSFEHAKAMHKEEINEAYANGSNDRLKNRINDDYYNETFNTEEKWTILNYTTQLCT